MDWISVNDRMPEPWVSVLVYMPEERPLQVVREVTHWMPMPEGPDEDEKGESR